MGLVALVALPVLAAVVVAASLDWTPASDWALIELAVRDVGSADTPLVGPFTRFGWNHPGPLLFWVLALPHRLLGSSSEALLVGAGLVNLAAVVAMGWLAYRRGGWALLAWTGLLVALLLHGADAVFLVDPWNPAVITLPFAVLGFLTWSLAVGDHRLAPLWVLVASFIVQSHVGYTPVVVAFGLWGVGWLLFGRDGRRPARPDPRREGAEAPPTAAETTGDASVVGPDRRSTYRWLAGAAMLGVVLWLPPLVEQLTTSPGNMGEVARHFTESEGGVAGPVEASRVFGRHLAPVGVWLGGDEPTNPFTGELIGGSSAAPLPLLAVFGVATYLAGRRRCRSALLLAGQTALGLLVGFVATSRITGEVFPYLFGWLQALALFVWLSVGWSVYRALGAGRREPVDRVAVPVLVAATAAVSVLTALSVRDLEAPMPEIDAAVDAVLAETVEALGDRTVVMWSQGSCLEEATYGLALQLDRQGVPVLADEEYANRYGSHRVWDGTNADVRATVVCRDWVERAIEAARISDEMEVVAYYDPASEAEEAEWREVDRAVRARLVELGREDMLPHLETGLIYYSGRDVGVEDDLLDRWNELRTLRGHRVAVIFEPPEGSPDGSG